MWTTPPVSPMRFRSGYTVDIIKPDGTTETVGPMDSYPADATAWFQYVVDQIGTWQFRFNSPGEYFPNGTWYLGRLTTLTNTTGYYLDSGYYAGSFYWMAKLNGAKRNRQFMACSSFTDWLLDKTGIP